MKRIINMTPHEVKIVDDEEALIKSFAASGNLARCKTVPVSAGSLDGLPLTKTEYGDVEGLPDQQPDVFYIVSALVRTRLPERKDLLSPGQQVRDDAGRVIGCKSLDCNL